MTKPHLILLIALSISTAYLAYIDKSAYLQGVNDTQVSWETLYSTGFAAGEIHALYEQEGLVQVALNKHPEQGRKRPTKSDYAFHDRAKKMGTNSYYAQGVCDTYNFWLRYIGKSSGVRQIDIHVRPEIASIKCPDEP